MTSGVRDKGSGSHVSRDQMHIGDNRCLELYFGGKPYTSGGINSNKLLLLIVYKTMNEEISPT